MPDFEWNRARARPLTHIILVCGSMMKAFLLAVLGAFIVAALSFLALSQIQENVWTAFTSESARVGNPGHNLLVHSGARTASEAGSRE